MLERLPDYFLKEVEKPSYDHEVERVLYYNPTSFFGVQDLELTRTKEEQLDKIHKNKWYTSERAGKNISLIDAAIDWFAKYSTSFCLEKRVYGISSGFVFHLSNGKGVFIAYDLCGRPRQDFSLELDELRKKVLHISREEVSSFIRRREQPEVPKNVFYVEDINFKPLSELVAVT